MEYGGTDRRKTKKDLKHKRLARVYKRGGQHRSVETSKTSEEEGAEQKKGKGKEKSKKGKRKGGRRR